MTQFLAVFVRAIFQDLQSGNHWRIKLQFHRKTDTVMVTGEPHSTAQVVRLRTPIAKPLQGRYFSLGEWCEHADLHNISSANVWDLKFTLFLNPLPLFGVDMVEQCPAFVEGRRRNFGWPVELRIVPLIELLLFLIFRIISLVRYMFVIVAHFVENRSLFPLPVNLLVPCAFQVLS